MADGAASRLEGARQVAGGDGESLVQPEWSPSGELFVVSDRSDWWNVHRVDGLDDPEHALIGGERLLERGLVALLRIDVADREEDEGLARLLGPTASGPPEAIVEGLFLANRKSTRLNSSHT